MNEENPVVSVLMSCYNAEQWLGEAVESVLTQTYLNFEFILINDGSSDSTWDMIQAFHKKDQRIVPVDKSNTGLADSLNYGIKMAKGQWIARLDADDICAPNRLEMQLKYVENRPKVILLGSSFSEIDENGEMVKVNRYPTDHAYLVQNLERQKRIFPHSSALYKREAIQKIGGGYNKRIKRAEDWDLWLRLSEIGEIACLDQPVVKIRKHPDQISLHQGAKRQKYDAYAGSVCHFLRQAGIDDPSVAESETLWNEFLQWVENKIDEERVIEKKAVWAASRKKFFSSTNSVSGIIRFTINLLFSRFGVKLIKEKIFGSNLCEKLASEWVDEKVSLR